MSTYKIPPQHAKSIADFMEYERNVAAGYCDKIFTYILVQENRVSPWLINSVYTHEITHHLRAFDTEIGFLKSLIANLLNISGLSYSENKYLIEFRSSLYSYSRVPEESLATFIQVESIDNDNNKNELIRILESDLEPNKEYLEYLMNYQSLNNIDNDDDRIDAANKIAISSMNNGIVMQIIDDGNFFEFDFNDFLKKNDPNNIFYGLCRGFDVLQSPAEKATYLSKLSIQFNYNEAAEKILNLVSNKSSLFKSRVDRIRSRSTNVKYNLLDKVLDNSVLKFSKNSILAAEIDSSKKAKCINGLLYAPVIQKEELSEYIVSGHLVVDSAFLKLTMIEEGLQIKTLMALNNKENTISLTAELEFVTELNFDNTVFCLDFSFLNLRYFRCDNEVFTSNNSFFSEIMTLYTIKTALIPELVKYGKYKYAFLTPANDFRGISYLLIQKTESNNVIVLPILDESNNLDGKAHGRLESLIEFIIDNYNGNFKYSNDNHKSVFDNYSNILNFAYFLDKNLKY